jgi:ArsR family transcriptional regulator, arsenate/arsenite/antimonite-responsive transcriptional repressor
MAARTARALPVVSSSTTDSSAALARMFHALSDPTRVEILERLRGGERCVCELTDLLAAAQSRLSFHLKTLRDAGLVTDRREGRWVYYGLAPEGVALLRTALETLTTPGGPRRASWASCCG